MTPTEETNTKEKSGDEDEQDNNSQEETKVAAKPSKEKKAAKLQEETKKQVPTFDDWEDDLEAVAEAVAAKSKDIEVPIKGADE